ncbi:cupin domain-containing protein [Streptomyces sp. WM6378]|uniref:cupin domain-containing protein n=1 Tax=Streptomyces sp. WM6378 TaxID=1415557 RepID=UPI0006AFE137|nr:cupin domain-containing protein [Streptomyces sp. WM6378]
MSFEESEGIVYIPPKAGVSRWVFGDHYTIKADKENTHGSLGLIEALVPPGGGPPLHIHHDSDEAFYLIDGELEISNEQRSEVVGTGAFIFVPRGKVHAFKNTGDKPCKMLIIFTPAGFERFFTELGVSGEGDMPAADAEQYARDLAKAESIVARYAAEYI